MNKVREGDIVLLLGQDGKRFIIRLAAGSKLHTHRGYLNHDDIIGQPLGRVVKTQLGYPFLTLEPSTHDLMKSVRRITQIVYPKDAGYILLRLNVMPGSRVVEAGTGSGALTLALARAVMPTGRVYSYESRPQMLERAHKNLERVGLLPYVELKGKDIAEGFEEKEVDALFLDLRTPWLYLKQAKEALKDGGFFGAILPTANQVSELLKALEEEGFVAVEVEELLLRPYKTVAERFRPMDRMVAHTGYLIFARKAQVEEGWFSFALGRAIRWKEGQEQ